MKAQEVNIQAVAPSPRGRAPECLGVLGALDLGNSYPTLGPRLSRDNFKDEASLRGLGATDPLPQ